MKIWIQIEEYLFLWDESLTVLTNLDVKSLINCGDRNPFMFYSVDYKMVQLLWKTFAIFSKIKHIVSIWPRNSKSIYKEMGIPDHLTCLLRNLYANQKATIRTRHGTTGSQHG